MKFGKHVVNFNIFDAIKHPLEEHSVFQNDFLSLSGFDDIYSCHDCTNTNLYVVCAEINDFPTDKGGPKGGLTL
jgi:hypothetical protein